MKEEKEITEPKKEEKKPPFFINVAAAMEYKMDVLVTEKMNRAMDINLHFENTAMNKLAAATIIRGMLHEILQTDKNIKTKGQKFTRADRTAYANGFYALNDMTAYLMETAWEEIKQTYEKQKGIEGLQVGDTVYWKEDPRVTQTVDTLDKDWSEWTKKAPEGAEEDPA